MARFPVWRVVMSRGTGAGRQPARQDPATTAGQLSPPPSRTHRAAARPVADTHEAAGEGADLNAYIARLAEQAPTLSPQQRDTLALVLGSRHRR
jgi:hypothetical protein